MFHRDWHAVREFGFGANTAPALASYATPLSPDLDRYTFEDPDAERQDTLDFIKTIQGGNLDPLTSAPLDRSKLQFYSDIAGWREPRVGEPFLVLKVDWLGDGTDIGYYSEADIATSVYQLHGRITSVGTISRAFGTDNSIQRNTVDLTLEDIDRDFAGRVRALDHLHARFGFYVGSPVSPPHTYTAIGARYRVLDVGSMSETEVSLTLIDATEDIVGSSIRPPFVSDLGSFHVSIGSGALAIDSTRWGPARQAITSMARSKPASLSSLSEFIPVPFGRAIYRSPFCWVRVPDADSGDAQNPLAVIVLGASKNKDWMRSWYYGDCFGQAAGGIAPIIYNGVPSDENMFVAPAHKASDRAIVPDSRQGLIGWIDVKERSAFTEEDAAPWYVATFYLLFYGNVRITGRTKDSLIRMKAAAAAGQVWIDTAGFGAAGQGATATFDQANLPSFGDNAVDVIEYLARYHSPYGAAALTGPSRVLDNVDDARTAAEIQEPVGGVITGETDGAEVVSEVASTFGLDIAVNDRGRAVLRPLGLTRDDRYLRIPTARTFTDEDHITEGSWQEFAPKGSDRWGFGTIFRWRGLGELLGDAPEFEFGYPGPAHSYNQEVEKSVNLSWRRQDFGLKDRRGEFAYPYLTPRFGARFSVHATDVLGLNPGDFCYVTHYAGSNADGTKGWDRRICRVDYVAINWEAGSADLTVIDWLTEYEKKPWRLDNAEYWVKDRPIVVGADYADMTASSDVVQFAGLIYPKSDWVGLEFRISRAYNPHPFPATDYATYRPTEARCGAYTITAVDEGLRQITLDAEYPETYRTYAWRVLRNHVHPPDDPYKYPDGDEIYGRACDNEAAASDGSIGAFSNGDPAYRLN